MSDLIVTSAKQAFWNGHPLPCAVGRNGFAAANEKIEGDGKTPIGRWAMREVFYRTDRLPKPETELDVHPLNPTDGWCDAPSDIKYNQLVNLPYPASTESLWREDSLYDLIVVLGYNDAPPVSGKGSALFLHVAREDFGPSEGCVHLKKEDLLTVLRGAKRGTGVLIDPNP